MYKFMASFVLVLPFTFHATGPSPQREALPVFAQLGLTPQQVAAIDEGRPVAKVLSWGEPSEIYVFGAVRVNGSPDTYLSAARSVERLAASPGYLATGELPAAATIADLRKLTLDADDIKSLKSCREGECDIQLPIESIRTFREEVDWSRPDAADQVNALARQMVLDLIREYRRGGNSALGTYRDKQHPTRAADEFETMIGRAAALPEVLPELRRYLRHYPDAELPAADSFFYWEKVDFGLKPTIRVNHAVIYKTQSQNQNAGVVAIKQLYSSHYFHTALDLSACVVDTTDPNSPGFYLLTLKASEQEGLTGMKGSVLRKIVVNKTRSSLEGALASIKRAVEQSAAAAQK